MSIPRAFSRLTAGLSKRWLGDPFIPTREGKQLPQMVKGFPTQNSVANRTKAWPLSKLVISVEQGRANIGHGAPILPLPPLPGKGQKADLCEDYPIVERTSGGRKLQFRKYAVKTTLVPSMLDGVPLGG